MDMISVNGQLFEFPTRGPAGPDGNPIGTIISFMGVNPPPDYLICDGKSYPIAEYPDLADFFEQQFGTKTYFGSDGEDTFKVPDLRNMFLRGFRGDASEQYSGNIGNRQEGTRFVSYGDGFADTFGGVIHQEIQNPDAWYNHASRKGTYNAPNYTGNMSSHFSARPTNVAVLFCIKSVISRPDDDLHLKIYSLEERIIGRWIDNKPLYRRTFLHQTPTALNQWQVVLNGLEEWEHMHVIDYSISNKMNPTALMQWSLSSDGRSISMYLKDAYTNVSIYTTFEYTKIHDEPEV